MELSRTFSTGLFRTHLSEFDTEATTRESLLEAMKANTNRTQVYLDRNPYFQTDRAKTIRDRLRRKLAKRKANVCSKELRDSERRHCPLVRT